MHPNTCVRGYRVFRVQHEIGGRDIAELLPLIIGCSWCAELDAGTCLCIFVLI